jgi:hypothetical protein
LAREAQRIINKQSIVDALTDIRNLAIDAFFAAESDKKKAIEKAVEAAIQTVGQECVCR